MKVLVVPDVHGSHEWEAVKDMPNDSYDFIVFMGDYFDSWENQWPDLTENSSWEIMTGVISAKQKMVQEFQVIR